MKIDLQHIGKRFNRDWIFRNVHFNFEWGKSYAITGHNGSGKSTLLQVIAGAILQTEGKVLYYNQSEVQIEQPYSYLTIVAPYLELVEEMTCMEQLEFHEKFKSLSLSKEEILKEVGLEKNASKQIRYFSSGMKQRLKLGLAFFSDVSLVLLDEPTSNLDKDGVMLYNRLLDQQTKNKTVIISSNVPEEYQTCSEVISIESFKQD